MSYRRLYVPGAVYFFTVVTYRRQPLFADPHNVELLRDAFCQVKQQYPFTIDAIVVLPDHIHALWSLPDGDADYSGRWRRIKTYFSRRCQPRYDLPVANSRLQKGEKGVWQRRFWEHKIRDERDFHNHVAYIHHNPVKHGFVAHPAEWAYSTYRRHTTPE